MDTNCPSSNEAAELFRAAEAAAAAAAEAKARKEAEEAARAAGAKSPCFIHVFPMKPACFTHEIPGNPMKIPWNPHEHWILKPQSMSILAPRKQI